MATTLQQSRSGYSSTDTVNSDAFNTNVPTLETMTLASLNALKSLDKGKGLFLQIEGGAIDWAAHANQTSRMVEDSLTLISRSMRSLPGSKPKRRLG